MLNDARVIALIKKPILLSQADDGAHMYTNKIKCNFKTCMNIVK